MDRGSIYPSWRYHADGRSELCLTPERDAEMGADWSDKDIRQTSAVVVDTPALETPSVPETSEAAPKRRGRPRTGA